MSTQANPSSPLADELRTLRSENRSDHLDSGARTLWKIGNAGAIAMGVGLLGLAGGTVFIGGMAVAAVAYSAGGAFAWGAKRAEAFESKIAAAIDLADKGSTPEQIGEVLGSSFESKISKWRQNHAAPSDEALAPTATKPKA